MQSPLITVLMPVYNGAKFLRPAMDSILGQTFKDFEFLIIDDGSSDDSRDIIKSYTDKRIRLVTHKSNLGLVKTLNEGLLLSEGKYIARMDCDDIARLDRLGKQYVFMEKNKSVAVCGSWANTINDKGQTVGNLKSPTGMVLKYNYWKPSPIIHPTAFLRSEMIKSIEFDTNALHAEDYDLWLRIARQFGIENISDYLLSYRVHASSISSTNRKKQLESSYKSFLNVAVPGAKVSYEEFLSLSSISFSLSFSRRLLLLTKLKNQLKIPYYFIFADNLNYLFRKMKHGQ